MWLSKSHQHSQPKNNELEWGGHDSSNAISIMDSFALWTAGHVKRAANSVAHILAQQAISLVDDIVCLECILIYSASCHLG